MKYENGPSQEAALQETLQEAYKKYQEGLGITLKDLKEKRIADIGCGDRALFIRAALAHGATDMTGVDVSFEEEILNDKRIGPHLIQAKAEELPLTDLDLIISHAAVGTHPEIDLPKVLDKMFRALKEGGELRIFPIPAETDLEGLQAQRTAILEALKALPAEQVDISFTPVQEIQISETEHYTDERLLIRKKSSQKTDT